ncbi:hypothetical protein ABT093_20100 [Kitasatospora sp. NPDC002551]|uniref:hypothetical protein n=1 Tax=Kitasatospora sp. NPDC002551 TaxID=3154539 RepID=UPI003333C6D1
MAEVMSPFLWDRIWALPVSPASVKFFAYLLARSKYGGNLPVNHNQKVMAQEYGKTPQGISALMAPLCELNIVLRPPSETRDGNTYRLHPLVAKYENHEAMEEAFREALRLIKARKLPVLRLPSYQVAPPDPTEGKPDLQVAC